MADISKEIQAFREAIYGEEVRGSMISLAEKMNKVSEDTEKAEKNRVTAETKRVNAEKEREKNTTEVIQNCENAAGDANTAAQAAEEAASAANTASKTAGDSATSANAAAGKANEAAQSANSAADGANTAEGAATTAAEAATAAAGKADTAASNANSKASTADTAADKANEAANRANKAAQDAEDVVAGKGLVLSSEKGKAGGVATLDASGKVPDNQIPDISGKGVTFGMASKRANVQSGDSLAVAFGKLARYCADLKSHTFADPINNLLGTDPKIPLAATMGKALDEKIEGVKSDVTVLNGKMLERFGSLSFWGDVSTGNNGGTILQMQKSMRADHLYIMFLRMLNGSIETFAPWIYVVSMRSNAWNYILLGEEKLVTNKEIKNGKLSVMFSENRWVRMTVFEVM